MMNFILSDCVVEQIVSDKFKKQVKLLRKAES